MKSFFILIFTANAYLLNFDSLQIDFSIEVWDYDYSMAYGIHYKLNSDSLSITMLDEIVGESDKKILLNRELKESEKKVIQDLLFTFPLEKLSEKYENRLVRDGDQKTVKISSKGKTRIIVIANYYQNDIANLFKTINSIVGNDFRINYEMR